MKWDYEEAEDLFIPPSGLFIICEGNFQYGNATLSFYDPQDNQVMNELFFKANGMKLGDVAQSMTIFDNKGWIVVNNSHVVFAIDINTGKETGRIENLTSPRYIHFVSSEKAYITQLWDNNIYVVNPQTYSVIGSIPVPDMMSSSGSTEQMVQIGRYVYCNCWSYQNRIIKIDTETDRVVDELTVGLQPNSLVKDNFGRLWTITDGGYEGSPYGYESPALYCIDAESFRVEWSHSFRLGQAPSELCVNGDGTILYWINDDIWRMDLSPKDQSSSFVGLPSSFIPSRGTKYYGLTIDPVEGDIYVADAIDYSQPGMIYRFSPDGMLKDNFYVGVTPGAFCWK